MPRILQNYVLVAAIDTHHVVKIEIEDWKFLSQIQTEVKLLSRTGQVFSNTQNHFRKFEAQMA